MTCAKAVAHQHGVSCPKPQRLFEPQRGHLVTGGVD